MGISMGCSGISRSLVSLGLVSVMINPSPVLAQTTTSGNNSGNNSIPVATPTIKPTITPSATPTPPANRPSNNSDNLAPNSTCIVAPAARAKKATLRTSTQASDQTLYAALIKQHGLDLAACRSRSAIKSYGLRLPVSPQSNADTIAALVDQAVDQGYNQLFVEVVNSDGLVLLPSQDVPRPWLSQQSSAQTSAQANPARSDANNPSSTVDPAAPGIPELDLWQIIVTAGQKRGVQIHGVIRLTVDPYDPFAPSLQDVLSALSKRQPTSLIFDLHMVKPLSQMGNGSRLQLLNKIPDPQLQALFQKFLTQGNLTAADITATENQAPPRPMRRRSQNPAITAQLTEAAFISLANSHQIKGQANLMQSLLYRSDRPNPGELPPAWGLWQTSAAMETMLPLLPNDSPDRKLSGALFVYPTLSQSCDLSGEVNDLAIKKCHTELSRELPQILNNHGKSRRATAGTGLHLIKPSVKPSLVCPVIPVVGDSSRASNRDLGTDLEKLNLEKLITVTASQLPSQRTIAPACVVVHWQPKPLSPTNATTGSGSITPNPITPNPIAPSSNPSGPKNQSVNWPVGR